MDRKWMAILAVAATAGAGVMLASPAGAQSMYDGIGTGNSSAVNGPSYQYMAPEGGITGTAPNVINQVPSQQYGLYPPESGEEGVGASSPGAVSGVGTLPPSEYGYSYDDQGTPIPHDYLTPGEPGSLQTWDAG